MKKLLLLLCALVPMCVHADDNPGGGAAPVLLKGVPASSVDVTTLIGTGVYDPYGAAANVQASSAQKQANLADLENENAAIKNLTGQPVYYVCNYGVACDGVALADLHTTAGSPNITSDSYQFQTSDVGKLMAIKAGTVVSLSTTLASGSATARTSSTGNVQPNMAVIGDGIQPGTFVVKILSGSSVQLSRPANSSGVKGLQYLGHLNVTILDVVGGAAVASSNMTSTANGTMGVFGTPDGAALNALVSTMSAAGGGVIHLPVGRCIVDQPINIASHISITGDGPGQSILKWIAAGDQPGPVINGNGATYTTPFVDNQMTYFEIDGSDADQATYHVQAKGISMPNTVRSVVDHVYIHDTPATCLATDQSYPTYITFNTLIGCGRSGGGNAGANAIGEGVISSDQIESYVIVGNYIENPGNACILMEAQQPYNQSPVSYAMIANNICVSALATGNGIWDAGVVGTQIVGNYVRYLGTANGWNGITLSAGTYNGPLPSVESLIDANDVEGAGTGIIVNYSSSAGRAARVTIANNRVARSIGAGIETIANAGTAMDGVKIFGNTVFLSGRSGIYLAGTGGLNNAIVQDNWVQNNGLTTPTDYEMSGVYISTAVNTMTFTGNVMYDNVNKTEKYGLTIASGKTITNAFVCGNNAQGVTTSGLNLAGTMTGSQCPNQNMAASETVTPSAVLAFSPFFPASSTTLTANTTFALPMGSTDGQAKVLTFCQGPAGGFTVTAPQNVRGFFTVGQNPNTCSTQRFYWSAPQVAWLAESAGQTNQ